MEWKRILYKWKMLYELINGNGYCIYYHWNEKLEFEGEILNGKRNGKENYILIMEN